MNGYGYITGDQVNDDLMLNKTNKDFEKKRRFPFFRIIKLLLIFLVWPLTMFTIGMGIGVIDVYNRDLPNLDVLDKVEPMQTTKLYATELKESQNGRLKEMPVLLKKFYIENRENATWNEIPQAMKDAVVAVEDHRFYSWYHIGIDPYGMARALIRNITGGRVREGASSITQQYVRNAFFGQERTFYRKFREMLLAIKIETEYGLSKDDILTRYMNRIWYGHGAYGIKSAARVYFNKTLDKLTKPECALLAGIVQSPSAYSPFRHPDKCQIRLLHVLKRMYETDKLSKLEYDTFVGEFTSGKQSVQSMVSPGWKRISSSEVAPYFVDAVRNFCVQRIRIEKTKLYLPPEQDDEGLNELYVGGFRIESTLDLNLQKIAEEEVTKYMANYEKKLKFKQSIEDYANLPTNEKKTPEYIQCCLVALDPRNGEIKAMVGGRNYEDSKFNRVIQAKRQPGSSFKPIVYTLALERQFTPAYVLNDDTLRIEDGKHVWMPKDYSRTYQGPMSMRYAIAHSVNVPAVRMAMVLGINDIRDFARKMGIHNPLPYTYSLALGTGEVSPIDMAAAYSIIANGGNYVEPVMVRRIFSADNKLIYEEQSPKTRIITPQTAYIMQGLLSAVLDMGTGRYVRKAKFTWPAGGKTGTTANYVDAWFIGFTPRLVCVVWVGFDKRISLGKRQTGSDVCIPLWTSFMKRAHEGIAKEDFERPSGIIEKRICKDTGKLASPSCPITYNERFLSGFEPTEVCEHDLIGNEKELPAPGDEDELSPPFPADKNHEEPIKIGDDKTTDDSSDKSTDDTTVE